MARSTFRPKHPPREKRVREAGEFANFTPQPRAAVPSRELAIAFAAIAFAAIDSISFQPQRVATTKTEAEGAYMGRVAALGCIVCRLLGYGRTPAQVHHVRAGVGKAQRAGNYCTLPLCEPHHTGDGGVHGDRACLRQLSMSELDLLDITIGELAA